jgi:hypothetical protein
MQGKKIGKDAEEEPLEGLACCESTTPGNIANLQRKR